MKPFTDWLLKQMYERSHTVFFVFLSRCLSVRKFIGTFRIPWIALIFVGASQVAFADDPQNNPLPTAPDLANYISTVGVGQDGWFGEYTRQLNGQTPSFFIPRCTPPDGSIILDFDSDTVGYRPNLSTIEAVDTIFQVVANTPIATISPNNSLHLDSAPLENQYYIANFAELQNYVGIYVGDVSTGADIELIGVNSAGAIVAVDRVAQVQASVTTCMAIKATDGEGIKRIIIRSDGDIYADRMFFSAEMELPEIPRQASGTIEFLQPTDNANVSTRSRLLVTGKVIVPLGLVLSEALISAPNWNRTSVITKPVTLGKLWDTDDESVYLFTVHGLYLPEGQSYISVTASGPGVIASNFIQVQGVGRPPLPIEGLAERVDIEPITIEVTQAVRGEVAMITPGTTIEEPDDTILVRDKPTVVRGFARLRFPDGDTFSGNASVFAELVGTRNGSALPGSPLSPRNLTAILRSWPDRAASYHINKQGNESAWVFELPESWTEEGEIDLRLLVNPAGSPIYIPEHPDAPAALNTIGVDRVKFRDQPLPKVVVWLVDYYFKCNGYNTVGRRINRDGEGTSRKSSATICGTQLKDTTVNSKPSVYDAAESILTWWNMAPLPKHFPDIFETYDYVFVADEDPEILASEVTTPQLSAGSPANPDTLGVAFRSDVVVGADGFGTMNVLMSDFVRGKAWGSPSFFRVTNILTTTAHEGAHTMGLRHTGNGHDESWWILRWSGDHGEIAQNSNDISMFDVRRNLALSYPGRHDYMSYEGPRWSSWDVWHHVEDAVGSQVARVDNRVDEHIAVFFQDLFGLGQPAEENEIVTISGNYKNGILTLKHGFSLPGGVLVKKGDVQFKVVDKQANKEYMSHSVMMVPSDAKQGEEDASLSFIAAMYVPKTADELVIEYQGRSIFNGPIKSIISSSTISAPRVWPATGMVEINWSAEIYPEGSDPQTEQSIRHLVQVSRDKKSWFNILETRDTRVALDVEKLPYSGPDWYMRVQSSTGIANTISESVEVDFSEKSIVPRIVYPRPGAKFSANTFVNLHAIGSRFAADTKDLQWWVNGTQIARGTSATVVTGEAGPMEIVLLAPASGEKSRVTIESFKDNDLDGMSDDWEVKWNLDPNDPGDKGSDEDQDQVVALNEFINGSSPESLDTDGDRYSDLTESESGTDPSDAESYPSVWIDGGPPPIIDDRVIERQKSIFVTYFFWGMLVLILFILAMVFFKNKSR